MVLCDAVVTTVALLFFVVSMNYYCSFVISINFFRSLLFL